MSTLVNEFNRKQTNQSFVTANPYFSWRFNLQTELTKDNNGELIHTTAQDRSEPTCNAG